MAVGKILVTKVLTEPFSQHYLNGVTEPFGQYYSGKSL